MPISSSAPLAAAWFNLRRGYASFAVLLLSSFVLATVSPAAMAQDSTVVEIGSGTLDADKQVGTRWVRLDVDPLATAVHTVTVSWNSDADLRFKVQEEGASSVSPTIRGTNPGVWQGELQADGQYYIGLWSTEGIADYVATVAAPVDPVELAITTQPADLTVAEGENANFSVVASGTGTLGYQWLADGVAIPNAVFSTLIIVDATLVDSGTVYSVQVTDDNGLIVSDGATLTVNETSAPLVITAQPADLSVAGGEDAIFSVTAKGSGTLGYQWSADGTPIPGATDSSLTLRAVTLGESDTVYSVLITDDNESVVSDGASLLVMPVSIAILGQGTLDADKLLGPRWVRLDFDSLGAVAHTVTVSWNSDADLRFKLHEVGGSSVSSTVRGTNPGVWQGRLEANGQYYIGLWSTAGIADYIATVEASVDPADLSIATQPADLTVTEGDDAAFSVTATGSGTLGYQWSADGTAIPGATDSTLTLGGVTTDDSGTVYTVEVSDGGGSVVSDGATLTVEAVHPAGGALARWTMNEPAGAPVMSDVSGNGRDGTIGPDVVTGDADQGATSYRWLFTPPTSTYQPDRIINVPHDPVFNPGSGDYSITMRYRTNVSFGNIIQKGQGGAAGGYWKIENPGGRLTCVFRGVAKSGGWNRKEVVSSRALNDGQYHTITCERVGTTLRLIVDGVLDDTAGNSTGSISNNQPISIGGKTNCDNVTTSCDYFSGWIDEISIGEPVASSLRLAPDSEPALFADDFSSGEILVWTNEESLLIDGTDGATAVPSALAELYGTPGYAWADIAPGSTVCAEVSIRLTSGSAVGAVDLLGMSTASDGGVAVVQLDDNGQLVLNSEVSGETMVTGVSLDGTWQRLRWCGAIGGAWSLAVDGVDVVSGWSPDTGIDPIGRFRIGTSQAATITVRFDDVVVTTD